MDLFNSDASWAIFSGDRKYRYQLFRCWDVAKPFVVFIGLNPSTANELKDDNTITKVKKIANNNGYGGVYMMNLFGLVSPYPVDLKNHPDPIGANDDFLSAAAQLGKDVVFAWGKFDVFGRDEKVIKMFPNAFALHINKNGSPKHPLYVLDNQKLIKFRS